MWPQSEAGNVVGREDEGKWGRSQREGAEMSLCNTPPPANVPYVLAGQSPFVTTPILLESRVHASMVLGSGYPKIKTKDQEDKTLPLPKHPSPSLSTAFPRPALRIGKMMADLILTVIASDGGGGSHF